MSLLSCKSLVFMFLGLDSTKVTNGSDSPDGYTHAQIDASINGRYQSFAADLKCVEKEETITVTTGSREYTHTIPSDYVETIAMTSSASPKFLKPSFRGDSDLLTDCGFQFFTLYGESLILYDATQAGGDTSIRHTYWAYPASLSADVDTFKFPLRNWERLIALSAALDLIAKDTSQSAPEKTPIIMNLYNDEFKKFKNSWDSKTTRNAGILDQTRLIGIGDLNNY